MQTFQVDVGFTTVRPVRPDQFRSRVSVSATNAVDAQLVAAQMVAGRSGVQMVTSTEVLF